jgi:hypothetical protein
LNLVAQGGMVGAYLVEVGLPAAGVVQIQRAAED